MFLESPVSATAELACSGDLFGSRGGTLVSAEHEPLFGGGLVRFGVRLGLSPSERAAAGLA